MKKYLSISLAFLFLLAGCEKDEKIIPTNFESNWHERLDMTNPTVKQMYDECGVGLLTDFEIITDLRFSVTSYWGVLRADKFERKSAIDSAYVFLQESFLKYFTNKQFIRDYFPRRILLSSELFLDHISSTTMQSPYGTHLDESDEAVGGVRSAARGSLHSIFNDASFAFSAKLQTIYFSQANYHNYVSDNMYIFLTALMERNKLYDKFGLEYHLPSMEYYYGKPLTADPELASTGYIQGIWEEEGNPTRTPSTTRFWFWNKGFVSNKKWNPVNATTGDIQLWSTVAVNNWFPSKERDVRTMFNQFIFLTQETWDDYPEIIKGRFAAMMAKFDEWGIDMRSFNPVIGKAFPR